MIQNVMGHSPNNLHQVGLPTRRSWVCFILSLDI
jgi:hypothetical protein